jgi:integrase
MRALAVTEDRLAKYVALRQEQGAANATINRELEGLQRAFSLSRNRLAFAPTFPNLPEENVREGFFDKADFFAVMEHVTDADVRDFCEWGFWTGMRRGEIAALTWAAFNKETWTITLPGRSAKNRKPRTVPVRGDLEPIIRRRLEARRLECPLVFHRVGQPIGDFRKVWKKACQRAGIGTHIFHDLRRTAVRNMVRAGVDIAVAMRISGHRTRSVFDRYNIVSEDDIERALDMTQAYVRNLSSGSNITPLEKVRTAG